MSHRAPEHAPDPIRSLDIADLNFNHASQKIDMASYHPAYRRRGLAYCMTRYFAKAVTSLRFGRRLQADDVAGADVLFVVETPNQHASVRPILEQMPEARVLSLNSRFGTPIPEWRAYAGSLPYLGEARRWRASSHGFSRKSFDHAFDEYLLVYGYFRLATDVLRRLSPKIAVFANDHNMRPRTTAYAAQRLGIATAYLQHASVTESFPPLRFDVSFLDGLDAAEKYQAVGTTEARVFLTGIAKADPVRRALQATGATGSAIGICVNLLDTTEAVVAFVHALATRSPHLDLVLRAHPSDRRPWRSLVPVRISDAGVEPSFEFLQSTRAIVSGPSNIILEAALAGVSPIFVDFGGRGPDQYGFVEHGLCLHAEAPDDAARLLDGDRLPPVDTSVLQRYCATVGTSFDGRAATLIAALLRDLADGTFDAEPWKELEGFGGMRVNVLREAAESRRQDGRSG